MTEFELQQDLKTELESFLNELNTCKVTMVRMQEMLDYINNIEIDKSAEVTAIIEEIKKIMAGRGLATQ